MNDPRQENDSELCQEIRSALLYDAPREVERSRTVRDAVTALPTRQRDVVLLHFVEGLSYREIARVQEIALGTVARRMKRALSALKQALGGV